MYATNINEPSPMTEAEYLAFADTQAIKYEYRQGWVYAMTGASVQHNTITANMITHINIQLGDQNCTVTSSDTRVHIARKRTYRYPDVTVFCGDPAYLEDRTDTITNPVLLVEVLSPSTAGRDSSEKLEEYIEIASLQAYVLVAQDKPKVEVYRRHEAGKWLYEVVTGLDAEISVPFADDATDDMRLSLAHIYRRVRWDEDDDEGDKDKNENDNKAGDR